MTDLILPKTFDIKSDNENYEKYKKHIGKPKLSYSQIGSFIDDSYRSDYIKKYFGCVDLPSGIYAEFGSSVGQYIEDVGNKATLIRRGMLSDSDIDIIHENINFPINCVYEDMVVIEVNDNLVMEGYIDRAHYNGKKVIIRDYKTGSIKNKADYYASNDYLQTQLYMYQKKKEGYEVGHCEVFLFDRAGNGSDAHPLRLTGDVKHIITEYDEKLVKNYLKKVEKTAKEISNLYKTYLKFLQ